MSYCFCIVGSYGCPDCSPKNWVKIKDVWYRKDQVKMVQKDCGCGERRMNFDTPPSAKPVDRQYQIDEELGRLERNTHMLAEVVDFLNKKLCRVLKPESPTDGGNHAVMTPQTPLAAELLQYNGSIEIAIQNLKDIIERIEIDLK